MLLFFVWGYGRSYGMLLWLVYDFRAVWFIGLLFVVYWSEKYYCIYVCVIQRIEFYICCMGVKN